MQIPPGGTTSSEPRQQCQNSLTHLLSAYMANKWASAVWDRLIVLGTDELVHAKRDKLMRTHLGERAWVQGLNKTTYIAAASADIPDCEGGYNGLQLWFITEVTKDRFTHYVEEMRRLLPKQRWVARDASKCPRTALVVFLIAAAWQARNHGGEKRLAGSERSKTYPPAPPRPPRAVTPATSSHRRFNRERSLTVLLKSGHRQARKTVQPLKSDRRAPSSGLHPLRQRDPYPLRVRPKKDVPVAAAVAVAEPAASALQAGASASSRSNEPRSPPFVADSERLLPVATEAIESSTSRNSASRMQDAQLVESREEGGRQSSAGSSRTPGGRFAAKAGSQNRPRSGNLGLNSERELRDIISFSRKYAPATPRRVSHAALSAGADQQRDRSVSPSSESSGSSDRGSDDDEPINPTVGRKRARSESPAVRQQQERSASPPLAPAAKRPRHAVIDIDSDSDAEEAVIADAEEAENESDTSLPLELPDRESYPLVAAMLTGADDHFIARSWMIGDGGRGYTVEEYEERDRAHLGGALQEDISTAKGRCHALAAALQCLPNGWLLELANMGVDTALLKGLTKSELNTLLGRRCFLPHCPGRPNSVCISMFGRLDEHLRYMPVLLSAQHVELILVDKSFKLFLAMLHPFLVSADVLQFCEAGGLTWQRLADHTLTGQQRTGKWRRAIAAHGQALSFAQRVVLWHRLEHWYRSLRAARA